MDLGGVGPKNYVLSGIWISPGEGVFGGDSCQFVVKIEDVLSVINILSLI